MKAYKFVLGILLFDLIFSLSSCIDFRPEDETVDEMMMELITTLDTKYKEKFKLFFSNEKIGSIENFDDSINELFNYYQGTYESRMV